MSEELNRRNTESVFAQLQSMEIRLQEAVVRIDGFAATLAELLRRTSVLEQAETVRRIAIMGRGPTEP